MQWWWIKDGRNDGEGHRDTTVAMGRTKDGSISVKGGWEMPGPNYGSIVEDGESKGDAWISWRKSPGLITGMDEKRMKEKKAKQTTESEWGK